VNIESQLPALLVVIPLLSAPLCALLPNNRLPWLFTCAVTWMSLICAALLLRQVLDQGAISYDMGGWPEPWGIEYRIDALNAMVLIMVTLIGSAIAPFAGPSVEKEIPRSRIALFYSLFLLCFTGLLGILSTGDIFNLFVFLEISSLSSYVLISLGRDRRALTAAYQYLIMGTIGATFFLIGIGLIYDETGTLNMADLAARLPQVFQTRTVLTGFAFIIAGIGLKAALFPVHLWLPNAYTYAPSAVSAFIAATATKVAVYVLVRILFSVFGAGYSFGEVPLQPVLLALSLAGIFVASFAALAQSDARRVLAFSSVAQIGYMTLGLALATQAGLTAALIHLFNHALMKGALFGALGAVAWRVGSTRLDDMAGIGRSMPWTMAAFLIGGVSLIGIPPTAGFISKWYLVLAALDRGWWWLAVLILLSSLIAVAYVWRIVEAAWFRNPGPGATAEREAPLGLLLPVWILAIANLWFGLDTRLNAGIATLAAGALFGSQP
jgi:multicomponent Na+:H+ antiporter subunit D